MYNFHSIKAYAGWGPRVHGSRKTEEQPDERPPHAGHPLVLPLTHHLYVCHIGLQYGEWKKRKRMSREGWREWEKRWEDMGGKIKPTPGVKLQSDRYSSRNGRLNPSRRPSAARSLDEPAAWLSCRGTLVPWQQGFCGPHGNLVMRLIQAIGAQKPKGLRTGSRWMQKDGHRQKHTHT